VLKASEDSFILTEWSDDGSTNRDYPVAPLHLHHDEDEAWYVLEGRLGFLVGEDEHVAEAGDAVVVPRGTPHTYWNAGVGSPARYLLVMGPETNRLIDAIHSASSRDPESLRELFETHGSELLG
jgi:mannose-6-phosphate isomerase-like protein (cupin superfamily)